ncbi:translation initiation factor IF-2 subunit beta [Haloarchaeobius sp. HME9146]|uniref:translation initiation factor IF-2 subunit beta n=1 Tax=unclassified Haloarchaeobius TaxID=2614452 RepID=UPI0021BDF118|nr:translation initiation factor IF-2 subunit beta [Haloarchaeobius sp. HME9146]MCT9097983.1 translation initiation factor IF-2 subunit beta [Haloarchaeobius sp. HME9146]
MEYDSLLDRAFSDLPDRPQEAGERLKIPDPAGETDGAFTRLTNLNAIADAVSRDAEHMHRSIQRELGTNGQFDGQQARYNGSFTIADFTAAIDSYVAEYVTCGECGLPDTRLVREDGIDMLRCEACGAFQPVSKNSSKGKNKRQPELEEGRTYQVKITGTGRKGDGVAERGNYTIFVPGAKEGQTVTVLIENISGNLGFARLA